MLKSFYFNIWEVSCRNYYKNLLINCIRNILKAMISKVTKFKKKLARVTFLFDHKETLKKNIFELKNLNKDILINFLFKSTSNIIKIIFDRCCKPDCRIL